MRFCLSSQAADLATDLLNAGCAMGGRAERHPRACACFEPVKGHRVRRECHGSGGHFNRFVDGADIECCPEYCLIASRDGECLCRGNESS